MALGKTCDEYKEQIDELETMILGGNYLEGISFDQVQENLEECQTKLAKLRTSIANKRSKLSVDGRLNFTKLMGNTFLKEQMNALALKQRIHDRLH